MVAGVVPRRLLPEKKGAPRCEEEDAVARSRAGRHRLLAVGRGAGQVAGGAEALPGDVRTDAQAASTAARIPLPPVSGVKSRELFDKKGRLLPEIAALAPKGIKRMGDNPHANGGLLLKDLKMPNFRDYAIDVPKPGQVIAESTREMGKFLRDVMKLNMEAENFRVFGPDEIASNRLGSLFEVTNRTWMDPTIPEDDHLSPDGRVMEILSEHTCQGWLEGYLLTGRHGLFTSYEAHTPCRFHV